MVFLWFSHGFPMVFPALNPEDPHFSRRRGRARPAPERLRGGDPQDARGPWI